MVVPDPDICVKVPAATVLPASEASSRLHSGRLRLFETVPVKMIDVFTASEMIRGDMETEM